MDWDYRIIKSISDTGTVEFGIYEAHYDEAGEMVLQSEESIIPASETIDDLALDVDLIRAALTKDILVKGS